MARNVADQRWGSWAWAIPAVALFTSSRYGAAVLDSVAAFAGFSLAGLVSGALWQLLLRRDLVDRLLPAAVLWALAVVLITVTKGDVGEFADAASQIVCVTSIVTGLVVCEAVLRAHGRRVN